MYICVVLEGPSFWDLLSFLVNDSSSETWLKSGNWARSYDFILE